MNTPLVLIGAGIVLIAGGFAIKFWRDRSSLLARPVILPSAAASGSGDVVVAAIARGAVTTSPWTGRSGLLFVATEVTEDRRRDSEGKTRTETSSRALGTHVEQLSLADDPNAPAQLPVRINDRIELKHANVYRSSPGGTGMLPDVQIGSLSLTNNRARIEERSIADGERVWVAGRLESGPDGSSELGGRLLCSTRDPRATANHLGMQAGIAAAIAAVGLVLAIIGAAG